MAKVSMLEREKRRAELTDKYAAKRAELKSKVADSSLSFEDKMEAVDQLNKLPKNSSPVRRQRRCRVTGRPHGVYRKFGLCRNKLREYGMNGDVPGLTKASW